MGKISVSTSANRPVNLDLTRMKFPPMAIVSIMHRISGVLLFLFLPFLLYFWHVALQNAASFAHIHVLLATPMMTVFLWLFVAAVGFHLMAGIRHMVMDFSICDSVCAARFTAWLLIVLEIALIALIGVWLW